MEIDRSKWTRVELLKESDPTLAGTIHQTLADPTVDRFSDDDLQFLKFHGIYQQDDRDLRKTGKKFIFMVRGRLPGGVVTPELYLAFDRLAREYSDGSLRITSRQGFQFHGVVKSGLGRLMRGINEALATTLAACGDVNRNVMAPPTPATSPLVDRVLADAQRLSDALLPSTKAYHQIWVNDQQLNLAEESVRQFTDPLYGRTYLPRKFKVAFAIPPLNDTDVFTNCLGFVAIGQGAELHGYNLLAGGGMGMTHGNAATFPRLADVIGFFTPEQLEGVAKAVLTVHRDFGDRTDRKHARLKYVLAEKGADWFREEVERRLGFKLEPARPFQFTRQGDLLGWHQQQDGRWFLGLCVQAGRIRNGERSSLTTALREVVERFRPEIRLTPSQNLLLVNVAAGDREAIDRIFATHHIPVKDQGSPVRRSSMACPALPTCGLALAESERVLPDLLVRLEDLLRELALQEEEISVRMTGCPNGCVRPYMAEIGIVGRAPNKYHLFLGGTRASTRMNRVYKENVKGEDLIGELRPLLSRFAGERQAGECFGDWCHRALFAAAPH